MVADNGGGVGKVARPQAGDGWGYRSAVQPLPHGARTPPAGQQRPSWVMTDTPLRIHSSEHTLAPSTQGSYQSYGCSSGGCGT
ncbi:hypothetical protein E2C01_058767 [Portunus trituberculatus]|uniref:Uncharacterized protein n=1 Tax=Portunus trituberculatus TaxID=210409 RepID=A0A5B7H3Y3_PORTR|nr:hypothetical protein [Portunus trituberculatus]